MKRWILSVALAACGSPAKGTRGGGATPVDDAAVAAFRTEMTALGDAFRLCHNRARTTNYRIHGSIEFEVGRPQEVLIVTVRQNGTGSNELAECSKSRIIEHEFAGVVKRGQIYRSSLAFPDRGPNYVIAGADITPLTLSDTQSVTNFLTPDNTGNPDATLAMWRLSAGLPLEARDTDEVWFVLGGEGKIYDERGAKRGQKIYPGSAVYVPRGVSRGYDHTSESPLVVIVAQPPAEAPKKKSKDKLVVKQIGRVPARTIGGGSGEVRMMIGGPEKAAVYIGAITLFAKAEVPAHQHEDSTELLYLIEGAGDLRIGTETLPVGPATAIQIPRGVEHAFKATSPTSIKAVQLYVPRGPEERFKKGKGK